MKRQQIAFVFEATRRCNQDCAHCYNAWKNLLPYPAGEELSTADTLAMLGKVLDETGASLVSLSGGEPMLRAALDLAQELAGQHEIPISCSIAMPPCLFDTRRWPKLSFGFCAAGTERAYYTLDPLGNVRPCNHSPTILGNIRQTTFAEMAAGEKMRAFMAARPAFCGGCRYELQCQGGCKAAAEACFGSASERDPFLAAFAGLARKPEPSRL